MKVSNVVLSRRINPENHPNTTNTRRLLFA